MNMATNPSGSMPSLSYSSLLAIQELAERLLSQVDSAHREIGETRAILQDAVERLMPAFTAIRGSEPRASMTEQSIDTARSARAVRAIGPAFSALQFQDISDQLLAHAQVRLASAMAELGGIVAVLSSYPSGHPPSDALLRMVAGANDKLTKLDISMVKPVGKAHLGTGDIDIF